MSVACLGKLEPSFFKSLVHQPKTIALPDQELNLIGTLIPENIQLVRCRILFESISYQQDQAINLLSEINRLLIQPDPRVYE